MDLASRLFIKPSVHQSSLIPFTSTHFDLFSYPSLCFGTHHDCKVTLAVSCPVPSRTRWKLRCMSSIYPSINSERPQRHAIKPCQRSAFQTIYSTRLHGEWWRHWDSGTQKMRKAKHLSILFVFCLPLFFIWSLFILGAFNEFTCPIRPSNRRTGRVALRVLHHPLLGESGTPQRIITFDKKWSDASESSILL